MNFRDEKTLLGVGQAQVRNSVSVESAPAFAVAAYGMLLVSGQLAFGNSSRRTVAATQMGCQFQRPPDLDTATASSTPR